MNAVVIDDDPAIVALLSRILKRKGYHVSAYENPSLCPLNCIETCPCAMAQASCPSVIITDITMPEVSGIDFVRRLKQKGCLRPRVAMMSGYWVVPREQELVGEMGATFLAKPFRVNQVVEWLDRITGKSLQPGPASPQ